MDSHELFAQRTFTIILHANDPYHVRLLEVPETEPFDKFLIRLQSFSKAAARQIFPLDERKYGLAGADGYWWFALINERGVPQPGRMIMRSERPYIWMKGRLLARDTRWKAALFRNEQQCQDPIIDNLISPSAEKEITSPRIQLGSPYTSPSPASSTKTYPGDSIMPSIEQPTPEPTPQQNADWAQQSTPRVVLYAPKAVLHHLPSYWQAS
ncbi:MAG: hypothetical protein L6R39_003982 [Caloplaca ligustica]|nr:MAG: hypothetical protein L6R39_003982 [Caloplaca ligustica]